MSSADQYLTELKKKKGFEKYLEIQESWETEACLFLWINFIYAVLYFYILFQLNLEKKKQLFIWIEFIKFKDLLNHIHTEIILTGLKSLV